MFDSDCNLNAVVNYFIKYGWNIMHLIQLQHKNSITVNKEAYELVQIGDPAYTRGVVVPPCGGTEQASGQTPLPGHEFPPFFFPY